MIVVTTHTNTDFDALASLVAASFLYPGAIRATPDHVQPAVREFLAVHWDLLQLRSCRSIDLAAVERLIITDTSSWNRLDAMGELAQRDRLSTVIWDHHLAPGTIVADEEHREEVGATVTLLLERIAAADIAFSPMHATLFLLGIYDDTGFLSFPGTTARDARMASFLLENGADLHVVSAYLDKALDERHLELFGKMLVDSEQVTVGSRKLGVCVHDAEKGLNMLPDVVGAYKTMKGLDAAFGIFPLTPQKTVVIGRGTPRLFDVGALVRRLGGGGHPGAGSATVGAPLAEVRGRVVDLLRQTAVQETVVQSLMSAGQETLPPTTTVRQAVAILRESGRRGLLVVDDQEQVLGSFGDEQAVKIKKERQLDQPVTAMMRRQVRSVRPDQPLREAMQLIGETDLGFLPVVSEGRLIGEITRAALILEMYEF